MPITIGELTTVPKAGDPITSPWAQTISTQYVVHQFTSVADRDAKWPTAPNGALCVTLDTYIVWQRRAGAWEQFCPRGHWYAGGTTLSGGTSPADVPGASVTIAMLSGHRYRIDFYAVVQQNAQVGIVNVFAANGTNGQIGAAAGGHVNTGWFATFSGVVEDLPAGPSGSYTYKIRAQTSAGTVTVQGGAVIIVTDVGIG